MQCECRFSSGKYGSLVRLLCPGWMTYSVALLAQNSEVIFLHLFVDLFHKGFSSLPGVNE